VKKLNVIPNPHLQNFPIIVFENNNSNNNDIINNNNK